WYREVLDGSTEPWLYSWWSQPAAIAGHSPWYSQSGWSRERADDQAPPVTALSSSSESRITRGKAFLLVFSTQRANATLKTATAPSAVRLAAGSSTPRRRRASARAVESDASLISSRSRSSGLAAMMAWRCREKS